VTGVGGRVLPVAFMGYAIISGFAFLLDGPVAAGRGRRGFRWRH